MKVLFIVDSLAQGGKERRLIELIKGIIKRQIEYRIILLTEIIEFEKDLLEYNIRPIVLKRFIRKDPLIFWKIYSICREFKPDVISTWGLMPSFYAFPVAKLTKTKHINSMIIDSPLKLDRRTNILSKIIFKYSDIICSNSIAGLDAYGVKAGNAEVIYNGFDFGRLSKIRKSEELKKELGIKTRYTAGMVAGFRHHKDYSTLIKAAKMILKERNDVSFILVGDGPTISEFREMARGFDNIIFTGKRSDAESIMNICDIGILSTYSEGISNSIMEFMALGKPVIATAGGGTSEIVEDSVTGYLVPQRSPEALSLKIISLIQNEEIRKDMGASAKERIASKFSIEKMIESYVNLFQTVIKKPGNLNG